MIPTPLSSLTGAIFSTDAMLDVFSARGCVQGMLDTERALARAEARVGVIPASAAPAIAACCDATLIDMQALARGAAAVGNLAIPLVKQLTSIVAQRDKEAAKYVHWGATSQDILDTGLVLQLRDALILIGRELDALNTALATLARRHRDTTLAGRTWMQHALPVTFGLKVAGWLDGFERHADRISAQCHQVSTLQFGGAAGTLASLGPHGLEVAQALADELQLALPAIPWHAQRDRIVEVATTLGMLAGSLGKMARDVSLLMQTDVAEATEPAVEGRGGSSTMPHKRNPVSCAATLSIATRVPGLVATLVAGMVQEHERGLGGWQAEWDALPELVLLVAGALYQMRLVAEGLTVDEASMQANLDLTRGQMMAEAVTLALGAHLGRLQAHQLVEGACQQSARTGQHLKDVLAADPAVTAHLSPRRIADLLTPSNYLGQAGAFVDRVLAARRTRPA